MLLPNLSMMLSNPRSVGIDWAVPVGSLAHAGIALGAHQNIEGLRRIQFRNLPIRSSNGLDGSPYLIHLKLKGLNDGVGAKAYVHLKYLTWLSFEVEL